MTPVASFVLTAIFVSTITLVGLAASTTTVERNLLAPTREASLKEKALAVVGVDAVFAPFIYLVFRFLGGE